MASVFAFVAITLSTHTLLYAHVAAQGLHTRKDFSRSFTASLSFPTDPAASACPSLTNTQRAECSSVCPRCHHQREGGIREV